MGQQRTREIVLLVLVLSSIAIMRPAYASTWQVHVYAIATDTNNALHVNAVLLNLDSNRQYSGITPLNVSVDGGNFQITIDVIAATYTFRNWLDGTTNATRRLVISSDLALTALYGNVPIDTSTDTAQQIRQQHFNIAIIMIILGISFFFLVLFLRSRRNKWESQR